MLRLCLLLAAVLAAQPYAALCYAKVKPEEGSAVFCNVLESCHECTSHESPSCQYTGYRETLTCHHSPSKGKQDVWIPLPLPHHVEVERTEPETQGGSDSTQGQLVQTISRGCLPVALQGLHEASDKAGGLKAGQDVGGDSKNLLPSIWEKLRNLVKGRQRKGKHTGLGETEPVALMRSHERPALGETKTGPQDGKHGKPHTEHGEHVKQGAEVDVHPGGRKLLRSIGEGVEVNEEIKVTPEVLQGTPHMSLMSFELIMLATLGVSLPIVYWRKIRVRHL